MARARGQQVDLSALADEEDDLPTQTRRRSTPALAAAPESPHSALLTEIALNPLNTRDVFRRPDKIAEIANSMREHGQIEPCAVVTRAAFLAIFAEHEEAIGKATYVQVTGARRYAAAGQAGLTHLDIAVKNPLAATRGSFVAATIAENIDREEFDPIEEARAVALVVGESPSRTAAAAKLNRTGGWITQKLALLELIAEVQTALRDEGLPVRQVRDWHKRTEPEQRAALAAWRRAKAREEAADGAGTSDEKPSRPSPTMVAIKRLGDTPSRFASSLREMAPEWRRALAREILADLPESDTD